MSVNICPSNATSNSTHEGLPAPGVTHCTWNFAKKITKTSSPAQLVLCILVYMCKLFVTKTKYNALKNLLIQHKHVKSSCRTRKVACIGAEPLMLALAEESSNQAGTMTTPNLHFACRTSTFTFRAQNAKVRKETSFHDMEADSAIVRHLKIGTTEHAHINEHGKNWLNWKTASVCQIACLDRQTCLAIKVVQGIPIDYHRGFSKPWTQGWNQLLNHRLSAPETRWDHTITTRNCCKSHTAEKIDNIIRNFDCLLQKIMLKACTISLDSKLLDL